MKARDDIMSITREEFYNNRCDKCAHQCDVMGAEQKPQRDLVKGCKYGLKPVDAGGKPCNRFCKKNREK